MEKILNNHTNNYLITPLDKALLAMPVFSRQVDKPTFLVRDLELVKSILVKDFQNFMGRVFSMEERLDPPFSNSLVLLKGQIWRHLRTNLTPVFTSSIMKLMFCLVDTCGKELADYVQKTTADGKLPQDQYSYKMYCKMKLQKLKKF